MKIGYIVHDLHDAAVRRRHRAMTEAGAEVVLAGFVRAANSDTGIIDGGELVLGQTEDAKLAKRAISVAGAMLSNGALRRHLADCDVIVARNLESLAIARQVVGARPLVYECLDIHRLLLGNGPAHRLVQAAESALLRRVDLILTSSPAFIREYFAHRPYRGEVFLLENRLEIGPFGGDPGISMIPALPPAGCWTIGWFGMLRCRRSLDELLRLAREHPDTVDVLIAGKPSPAELSDLPARVSEHANVTYAGPYRPQDLRDLYARCHFSWCIDWFEEGLNSAWLLPNRLYESTAFGAVPIALESVETGRWLADRNCGLVVENTARLGEFLHDLQPERYMALRRSVEALERSAVIADAQEAKNLMNTFAQLQAGGDR